MAASTKQNGTWHDVTGMYVKVNGVWQPVASAYIKENNTWKEVYQGLPFWEKALAVSQLDGIDISQYTEEIDDGLLIAPKTLDAVQTMSSVNEFYINLKLPSGTYQIAAVGGGSSGNNYYTNTTYFRYNAMSMSLNVASSSTRIWGGSGGLAAQLTTRTFSVMASNESFKVIIGKGGAGVSGGGNYGNQANSGGTTSIYSYDQLSTVFSSTGASRNTATTSAIAGVGCYMIGKDNGGVSSPTTNYSGQDGASHQGNGGAFTDQKVWGWMVYDDDYARCSAAKIGGGGGEGSYFSYGTNLRFQSGNDVSLYYNGWSGYGYGAGGGGGGVNNNNIKGSSAGAPGALFIKQVG